MNGTPPTHPAISTSHIQAPAPLITKAGTEPKNWLADLPTTLIGLISDDLPPPQKCLIARLSTSNNRSMQEYFRNRLKPECRSTENPMVAYKDPSKRLGRYLEEDRIGRKYLQDLNFHRYMVQQIVGEKVSVEEARLILAKNRETIEAAKKTSPGANWVLTRDQSYSSYLYCVECGLLTVNQYLSLSFHGQVAIRYDGVQKYLASGDLKPELLNGMCEWAAKLLSFPAIQQAIERHEVTVNEFATMADPPALCADLLGAYHYLYNGPLQFGQSVGLKQADFEDLTLPAVQHQLDTGKMTMSQMLAMKSEDRRKLTLES